MQIAPLVLLMPMHIAQGVSGPIAVWANRKYHGHRILPPKVLTKFKNEFHKKYGHD